MNVIKIGKYRVNLDLVAYTTERISPNMQQREDKTWNENPYAKDEDRQPGLVVDVTFCAMGGESEMYIRFYVDEAKKFLEAYDRVTGLQS